MGGSFSEIGGHNPLEPALFNKPVMVGHNMSNFNEIMQQLRQENAIIELSDNTPENESSTQLANEVDALMQHPKRQQTLGENALKVVLKNQGASEKTLAQVAQLLPIGANITSSKPLGDNS